MSDLWAELDAERWVVESNRVGDKVHVYPLKNVTEMRNWELYAGRRGSYLWRSFFIFNRPYVRTEKQLAKALKECQRFCDRQNAKEDQARALEAQSKASGA